MENVENINHNTSMDSRIIALVDCDSFFVSCEQADNEVLKNKPVCVISGPNGCVLSRSKEAKQVGVRMGMPMFMAKKEFPDVDYIVADHIKYRDYSKRVMECLFEFSPDVEIVSVDEAYIDLTGTERLFFKSYDEIVRDIRTKIMNKTDIPVSIGLATSKILAKLASDKAKKTGGFYKISSDNLQEVLKSTDISEVCGIGKQNNLALRRNGILLASEFVNRDDNWIKSELGILGVELKRELLGECISKVSSDTEPPKSIQSTSVIGEGVFTDDINIIKSEISSHINTACTRLRLYKGMCKTVGLMLRQKDFMVVYDKKILLKPTNLELNIQKVVSELLPKLYRANILYRATGIVLEDITYGGEQLSLFEAEDTKKERALSKCIENIEHRFGKKSIRTGF